MLTGRSGYFHVSGTGCALVLQRDLEYWVIGQSKVSQKLVKSLIKDSQKTVKRQSKVSQKSVKSQSKVSLKSV